jgi:hypothetical protein
MRIKSADFQHGTQIQKIATYVIKIKVGLNLNSKIATQQLTWFYIDNTEHWLLPQPIFYACPSILAFVGLQYFNLIVITYIACG